MHISQTDRKPGDREQDMAARELKQLLELEDGLSDWEANFLDDMAKVQKGGGRFSSGQLNKIRQIWEQKAGRIR